MLKGTAQLVRTRRPLRTTTDSVQTAHHVVDMLAAHQLADALQITVTTTQEEHLLDDIVLVGRHINELRARSLRLILYVFCLHTLNLIRRIHLQK